MTNLQKLHDVLHKVFGIPAASVTDQTHPGNVATWDSMNAMILVSELERVFKVKFTTADIAATQNVGDIKEALKRHGVTLE